MIFFKKKTLYSRHEVERRPLGHVYSVPCRSIVKEIFGENATFNM